MTDHKQDRSAALAALRAMGYERLKEGLVGYVRSEARRRNDAQKEREVAKLARKLKSLAVELSRDEWGFIQGGYDFFAWPPAAVLLPFVDPYDSELLEHVSYANLVGGLQALAGYALGRLDPPATKRKRRAPVAIAADGLVFLRYCFAQPRPLLYDHGNDVAELGEICERAGVVRTPVRLRNALSDALRRYDEDPSSISFGFIANIGRGHLKFEASL